MYMITYYYACVCASPLPLAFVSVAVAAVVAPDSTSLASHQSMSPYSLAPSPCSEAGEPDIPDAGSKP